MEEKDLKQNVETTSTEAKIAELEKVIRKRDREIDRLKRTLEQEKIYNTTKESQVAAQLLASQERDRLWMLLLHNSRDMLLFFDSMGCVTFCTDSFLRLIGFSNIASVSGRRAGDVFIEICGAELTGIISQNLGKALAENIESYHTAEADMSGKGDRHKYHIYSTPMIGSDKKNEGAMLLFHDVTDIERAREEAEQANAAKSDFLSNMSHEMRTPMNAIIGMTAIAKGTDDAERKDYCLNKIEDASNHLLGVINDILDMSKIEANKLELSLEEFNFEKMLKKVLNVVRFRAEEKKLRLLLNMDNSIPRRLVGDDQRLAQVIANLLSNAVKFTPDGGSVGLSARLIGENKNENADSVLVRIEVMDTGIGISAEQQANLFTAFRQADNSTSRKFGGTGLGLAISKRIMEMMGGDIEINSELGKGSVFSFEARLGLACPSCGQSGGESAAALPRHGIGRGIRLLAADSDSNVLACIASAAAALGLPFVPAHSGAEALTLLAEDNHSFCFVGKVDDMEGVALVGCLKERVPDVPVALLVSVSEWSHVEKTAKGLGVDHFLTKPVFLSDVEECLDACLAVRVTEDASSASEEDNFSGSRLLLAEDVDINREIVTALLEPTHISIDCAENGAEALRKFREAPAQYDMIFMDIQMPEMDGLTATRRIRELPIPEAKRIPIVAMTANVFREDVERCIAAGMDDHVGKPLDLEEVKEKLRLYLRG